MSRFSIAEICCVLALSVAFFPASNVSAADIPLKMDEKMAAIVAASAHGHGTTPDDLEFDGPKKNAPFFEFYGIGLNGGSFGFFAVNPWTGDVWDLWDCRKVSSAASRKMQLEIRHRFTHQELNQYAKLRRLKPECM